MCCRDDVDVFPVIPDDDTGRITFIVARLADHYDLGKGLLFGIR
jgi:hypothetical protein